MSKIRYIPSSRVFSKDDLKRVTLPRWKYLYYRIFYRKSYFVGMDMCYGNDYTCRVSGFRCKNGTIIMSKVEFLSHAKEMGELTK